MFRWGVVLGIGLVLVTLPGCGGGGGGGGSTGGSTGGTGDKFAKPKVAIAWSPRTKAVDAPSSALSAMILLHHASKTGGDVSYSVDRSGPVGGSTVVYTGSEDVKVAATDLTVQFYAGTGAAGALVGTASGTVQIGADGTISTGIETVGTITSVEVPNGQTMSVGETRALDFGARDSQNNMVAVSPGSALWAVTSGSDKLTFSNGNATAVAVGEPQVTATVDGKTSSAAAVTITDPSAISVSVLPSSVSVLPGGTQQFSAQVQGTGNTNVTWSVVEAGGGTVTPAGSYTAPATAGTYTVKATSAANPQKSGTATIHVEDIHISLAPLTPTVVKGGTVQFTATVTGTANQGATWSVVETGGGTVDANGLYTAPNATGTFTVKATSKANAAISASTTVTVIGGSFATIGRVDNSESGMTYVPLVMGVSEDGSTVFGSAVSTDTNPAYWTEGSGWVFMPVDLSAAHGGTLTVCSADGSAFGGYSWRNGLNQPLPYYWSKTGGRTHLPLDPDIVAISSDGKTLYVENGNLAMTWNAQSGYSNLTNGLDVRSVSADGSVLGGMGIFTDPSHVAGVLWTSAGGFEELSGSHTVTAISADGTAALGSFGDGSGFYWTRSSGMHPFSGPAFSMSRNGKYVIYHSQTDAYLWDAQKGDRTLSSILVGAGADASLDFLHGEQYISGDGKVIAGTYSKAIAGGGTAKYAFYAKLPLAP